MQRSPPKSIAEVGRENNAAFAQWWLSRDVHERSLLATAPYGGLEVMDVLLANPDLGLVSDTYTLLMNAAS